MFTIKYRQEKEVLEKEKKLVIGIWVLGEFISVRDLPNSDPAQKSQTFQTCIVLRLFYRCG